ncbi:MAG: PQ-loop domain-containing transporter [Mariprofundus sp.]
MDIDLWQMMGSVAALAFSVSFVDQLRITCKTRNVEGISLFQWMVFAAASGMFTAYYIHLNQWLMVAVSLFGTSCCLIIIALIFKYRRVKLL